MILRVHTVESLIYAHALINTHPLILTLKFFWTLFSAKYQPLINTHWKIMGRKLSYYLQYVSKFVVNHGKFFFTFHSQNKLLVKISYSKGFYSPTPERKIHSIARRGTTIIKHMVHVLTLFTDMIHVRRLGCSDEYVICEHSSL